MAEAEAETVKPDRDHSMVELCGESCRELTNLETPLRATSSSSFEALLRSDPEPQTIVKYDHQEKFKLRFGHQCTLSLTVYSPMRATELKNILAEQESLKFACFRAGIAADRERFGYHGRIVLSSLKRLTIQIPDEQLESSLRGGPAFSENFKRLLHFLKEITYGKLECIRITCNALIAARIPLHGAFIPTYEESNSHPLIEFIRRNHATLQSLVIGPNLNEMMIKVNPKLCEGNFLTCETFTSLPELPLLHSLSRILRTQNHLSKLEVTISHSEVWKDVCEAIKASSEHLEIFSLTVIPMDGKAVLADLKALQDCRILKELSLKFPKCSGVVGWNSLPESIKKLNFPGVYLFPSTRESMNLKLPNLEEVSVFFSSPNKAIISNVKCDTCDIHDHAQAITPPEVVDIVHHPVFHFFRAAPKTLKTFHVETDVGMTFDWKSLRLTAARYPEFRLVERSGDFSLERISKSPNRPDGVESQDQNSLMDTVMSPCFGSI